MATCRECIHWSKCSRNDGTTRYYGKEIACGNADKLCEWFISTTEVAPRADTVRKMQERLHKQFSDRVAYTRSYCHDTIDEIAKEMIENE